MAFWEDKSTLGYKPSIIYSPFFVWLLGLFIVISWSFGIWVECLICLMVIAGVMLAISRDTLPVLSIFWLFMFCISTNRHSLTGYAGLLWSLIAVLIGMVIHFIRFRPKFDFLKKQNIRRTTIGMLVGSAAMCLGGLTMNDRNGIAVLAIIGLAIIIAFCYLFFNATIDRGKDGKRLMRYLLLVMLVTSLIISAELVIHYARLFAANGLHIVTLIDNKAINLGWGGTNNYSILLGMCMPAIFYYIYRKPRLAPLLFALLAIQLMFVVLSNSRGATLFTAVGLVLGFIYLIVISGKNRLRILLSFAVVCSIVLVITLVFQDKIRLLVTKFAALGLSDNGRFPLYRKAWENFKDSPIFGKGFDFNLGGMAHDGYTPYWYHSTFFQILSSLGLVGIIGIGYLGFSRYMAFLTPTRKSDGLRKQIGWLPYIMYRMTNLQQYGTIFAPYEERKPLFDMDNFTVFLGLIIFDLYAMVDVFFFTPNGLIFLAIMTLAIEKALTKSDNRPLFLNISDR